MSDVIEITAADGFVFTARVAGAPDLPVALVLCDALPSDTPHARRMGQRLAAFGYRVVAPHLLDRIERTPALSYRPAELQASKRLRDQLGADEVIRDLAATAATIGHDRIGIIGFGWGGTAVWHAATRLTAFRAGVAVYGGGIADARQMTPCCPMHLMFAESDPFIPLADVESIRRAHPEMRVTIYPGAHGFACEEREIYNPASWAAARDDALGFFRRHL